MLLKNKFMPAEWNFHSQCWMLWPRVEESIWRKNAIPAKQAFANVARAIASFEPVIIGTQDVMETKSYFCGDDQIQIVKLNYHSSWMRDVGPTFVISQPEFGSALHAISWQFNGWGKKYHDNHADNAVAEQVSALCGAELIAKDFVLEGGSIHVDGDGTVLTTEECLLHPNRNSNLCKLDIEKRLCKSLGADKVIWLPRGLTADDDTNGHVDNICCFSRPGEVILSWCDDPNDEQYHICREAFHVLSTSVDAKERRFSIIKLPIPSPMSYTKDDLEDLIDIENEKGNMNDISSYRKVGKRLASSYVNFYMANGGIVCPSFGQPDADLVALQILQRTFPERKVVQIFSREILLGGGNIHCITQQQPKFMLQPIFLIDNRQTSYQFQSFEAEAAYASYHSNIENLLGKYICLSMKYTAFGNPACIGFAQSPDKMQLLKSKCYNLQQLHNLLEPKYTCVGGANIPMLTWSRFFLDGILKVRDLIQPVPQSNSNNNSKSNVIQKPTFVVIFISNDICLLGNENSSSIENSVRTFINECGSLILSANIIVRVVCTVLSRLSDYQLCNNSNLMIVHSISRTHSQTKDLFTFHQLFNTVIHFSEELRVIIRLCCFSYLVNIDVPPLGNTQCSVLIELSPSTITSADFTQSGMETPELFGLVNRKDVDPICLNGRCLLARCPSFTRSNHILTSSGRHHQNYLAFRSLARFLANENLLLILKFPLMLHCTQYWALIPPSAVAESMRLPADSMVGQQSEKDEEANDARNWDQMTMIHLVDKDDLMVDIDDIDDGSRAIKATTEPANDESIQEDNCTVAEIESYISASLKASLGPPVRYNPFACPSKKIDLLV